MPQDRSLTIALWNTTQSFVTRWCPFAMIFVLLMIALPVQAGFVTLGNGLGSKWGDPVHGTESDLITWSFLADDTTLASSHPLIGEVAGGTAARSNISMLRIAFDTANGAGAFNSAVQNAFNTWSAASGGRVVFQQVADNGAIAGDSSNLASSAIDIRIGAFHAAPSTFFADLGAVGYGPPGNDLNPFFRDALAGDIILNLDSQFFVAPGNEGDTFYTGGLYRNDLEGLILHELGHAAIGLGHPDSGIGDVMYVGPGAATFINRQLSPDDIRGLQSVYGITAVPEPCSMLLALLGLGCSARFTLSRKNRSSLCVDSV